VRRQHALDTLEVRVESTADVAARGPDAIVALAARVQRKLHESIGLTAEVTITPPRSLERSPGKARRVLDLREAGAGH
jgi:phenylacetate-CoA ligase